jgi:hypothetical protein
MIQLTADDLNALYEYYNQILGYHPGVADKSQLRRYAQSYPFVPFDYQTVVESFLQEYSTDHRKLDDVPVELWTM